MKGGLAVMLDLARSITEPVMDVTYLWYVCEEVAQRHSGLKQIEEVEPKFLVADAAILAEPTAACVEAGCQGVIRIEVCLGGVRAHTARSHMGVNAIHRLGPILERIVSFVPREPVIDACSYRESLQAVSVNGGVATNVVPDEAKLVVSYRYAPDRSEQEALGELNELLGTLIDPERDRVTLTESDLGAAPNLAHPLLAKLVAASAQPPKAKLGWTDVSFFNARGVPATNFGPGDPALAHSAGEWVGQDELEAVRDSLGELISSEA
jgi:succinyl-diaminopimelate desuccinylase